MPGKVSFHGWRTHTHVSDVIYMVETLQFIKDFTDNVSHASFRHTTETNMTSIKDVERCNRGSGIQFKSIAPGHMAQHPAMKEISW